MDERVFKEWWVENCEKYADEPYFAARAAWDAAIEAALAANAQNREALLRLYA